jgi:hypothetical protein
VFDFKMYNETREVDAEVLAVGANYWDDIVCKDNITGSTFKLDAFVGEKNEKKFQVGDKFKAIVHPVLVVFAVHEWIEK